METALKTLRFTLAGALFSTASVAIAAAEDSVAVTTCDKDSSSRAIVFNHASPGETEFKLRLKDSEVFSVAICNTSKDDFTYEIKGFVPIDLSEDVAQASNADSVLELENVKLTHTHDKRYGGYFVNIRSISGAPVSGKVDGETKTLKPVTLTLIVDTPEWNFEFAGGFVINGLTDPEFTSVASTDSEGNSTNTVVRDKSAEDEVSLGLATMIHVFHPNVAIGRVPLALSFGLGINSGSNANYLVGLTGRMGKAGAVTAGYNWGSRKRLPKGLSVGDTLDDPARLNDLGSKIDGAFFLSFSYTFLGSDSSFKKAFAGGTDTPQPAVTLSAGSSLTPETKTVKEGNAERDTDGDGIVDAAEEQDSP